MGAAEDVDGKGALEELGPGAFDGVWEALSLAERARAADLLLRGVVYDGRTGSIGIELRIDESETAGRSR